jgi:predicted ATPase with chaperone activity
LEALFQQPSADETDFVEVKGQESVKLTLEITTRVGLYGST